MVYSLIFKIINFHRGDVRKQERCGKGSLLKFSLGKDDEEL